MQLWLDFIFFYCITFWLTVEIIIRTCYNAEYGYLNIFDKSVPETEPLHYVLTEDEFTTRLKQL